jgi:Icc-related predicted phosphoesterase
MKTILISDTHNRHKKLTIPNGDLIIHAGDFSNTEDQIEPFLNWFAELPHQYKILIAGNHDYELEDPLYREQFKQKCHLLDINFLHDSSITIEGIKFHGSPWSTPFGNYPFMTDDLNLQTKAWDLIPEDTNVLITHGPAKHMGDEVYQKTAQNHDGHVGSYTLKMNLNKLKKLTHHFYGHIHESYGVHQKKPFLSANGSSFNFFKTELNPPLVFNLEESKH